MKVKLNMADRFALHSVLPAEAHIIELKAMKPLREALLPDADEQKTMGMVINAQGQPQWQREQEGKPKSLDVPEVVFDIVRRELKKLEEANPPKLREGHLHIYEIFVENDYPKEK